MRPTPEYLARARVAVREIDDILRPMLVPLVLAGWPRVELCQGWYIGSRRAGVPIVDGRVSRYSVAMLLLWASLSRPEQPGMAELAQHQWANAYPLYATGDLVVLE